MQNAAQNERMSKHKGCSHLSASESEEDEEVIEAKCHGAETYSSIQVNREDD